MASYPATQLDLNWTIVGQGAIGLLAACRLQQQSNTVTLHLRQPNSLDIMFTATDGQQQQYYFSPAVAPYQAVLVPVKSYDVLAGIKELIPLLSTQAQIILSHNGMGTIEQVLPLLLPSQGLWFLTTTHAALKTSATTLQHTGQGQSVLAPLNLAANKQSSAVKQAMTIALGPVQLATDIKPFLWQKLLINAVINPLTAINNCKNGDLLAAKYTKTIQQLVTEVCAVSQATGYKMAIEESVQRVRLVMQATATNFSSMQQDVYHQRQTEINAISGFIVEQGRQYAINTPVNLQLQQQVLQLQQSYGL